MDVLALTFRYFKTRPMAWVAALFMAIMVTALIVVTSVMAGFRARIRANLRSFEPDLSISLVALPRDGAVARRVREELRGEMVDAGGEIVALSPRYEVDGLIRVRHGNGPSRREIKRLVHIRGIDWESELLVLPWKQLCDQVDHPRLRVGDTSEDPLRATAIPGMIVGWRLGNSLGLESTSFGREDEATLVSVRLARGADGKAKASYSNVEVLCVGAVETGRRDHDQNSLYVDRDTFRDLRYGGDSSAPDAHFLVARLKDATRDERVASELMRRHPNLRVKTWRARFKSLLTALKVETAVTTTVLFVIVSLAVVLLLGVLYMLVLEKRRDVGILRSMGMSKARIMGLFGCYGLLVGSLGVLVGVAGGVAMTLNLDPLCLWLWRDFGFQLFKRGGSPISLPWVLDELRVASIAVGALVMTAFSVAIAARKAGALEPVDCLGDDS